jgi:hypothetical protein
MKSGPPLESELGIKKVEALEDTGKQNAAKIVDMYSLHLRYHR